MHHSAEWQQYGPFHLTRDWKGDLENNSDPTEVSKEFPTRSYTANVLISGLSSHGKERLILISMLLKEILRIRRK